MDASSPACLLGGDLEGPRKVREAGSATRHQSNPLLQGFRLPSKVKGCWEAASAPCCHSSLGASQPLQPHCLPTLAWPPVSLSRLAASLPLQLAISQPLQRATSRPLQPGHCLASLAATSRPLQLATSRPLQLPPPCSPHASTSQRGASACSVPSLLGARIKRPLRMSSSAPLFVRTVPQGQASKEGVPLGVPGGRWGLSASRQHSRSKLGSWVS